MPKNPKKCQGLSFYIFFCRKLETRNAFCPRGQVWLVSMTQLAVTTPSGGKRHMFASTAIKILCIQLNKLHELL